MDSVPLTSAGALWPQAESHTEVDVLEAEEEALHKEPPQTVVKELIDTSDLKKVDVNTETHSVHNPQKSPPVDLEESSEALDESIQTEEDDLKRDSKPESPEAEEISSLEPPPAEDSGNYEPPAEDSSSESRSEVVGHEQPSDEAGFDPHTEDVLQRPASEDSGVETGTEDCGDEQPSEKSSVESRTEDADHGMPSGNSDLEPEIDDVSPGPPTGASDPELSREDLDHESTIEKPCMESLTEDAGSVHGTPNHNSSESLAVAATSSSSPGPSDPSSPKFPTVVAMPGTSSGKSSRRTSFWSAKEEETGDPKSDPDLNSKQSQQSLAEESMTPILSTGLDGEKVVVPDALAAARRFQVKPSNAAGEWEQQKREDQEICDKKWAKPLDDLMALVGLEEVKAQFLAIKAKIDTCGEQNINLKTERFNVIFQGNPGTGKTTVANLFAAFMRDVGAIESSDDPSKKSLKVRSGATMAFKGAKGAKKSIKKLVKDAGGGTLFVDEAYQLVAPHASSEGRQVLDIILTEMEKNIGKLLVIFVGYKNEMEVFFEHNPGLGSRIPYTIHFEDFTDDELWRILCDKIEKRYSGKMRVEDGLHGLYMHIAIRRLGLGRGSKGFGNARAVENLLATISERQALRIREEVRKHKNDKVKHKDPNRFFFTKEDLIGPDPSIAKKKSKAWKELKELIGLDAVKKAVENFFGLIESNYRREISERRPIRVPLNQVFVGSPGTGKTTVARLYGRILADLGLLSRGDVVLKNPSDFIGDAVGKSEANTRGILASTAGKVLVIDEAYMLHPGDGQTDSYRNGVIDTIVAEVQGVLGEDRCVILVGYEDKLRNMFHHVNPGLSRRFPIENAFRFENFSKPELEEIMRKKMDEQDLNATDDAYRVAGDIFARALMRPNFSNAGEVETLMAKAKMNYEARYAKVPIPERPYDVEFQQEDIDPDFARGSSGESSCRLLLDGLVAEKIITRLERYQKLSMAAHRYKVEPRVLVPTCIVFKGPPGTGKTTAAHKMGKVFYDIGFLSTDEVISCTVSDLVGQYVGQTAPKTKTQLQKALGKVLIIDDAHQLKEGYYASEAANELTMFLTREENTGKIVVILIGQTYQIEELMVARPALSGLFTEEIAFEDINSRDSMSLLQRELANRHVQAPFLKYSYLEGYMKVLKVFDEIRSLLSWNNARHIQAFAKRIAATHMQEVLHDHETHDDDQDQIPPVSAETVLACLNQELFSHKSRSKKDTTDEQKNASVSPFDPSANPFRIANEIRNAPPPPITHTYTDRARRGSTSVFHPLARVHSITSIQEDEPPFSPLSASAPGLDEIVDAENEKVEKEGSVHSLGPVSSDDQDDNGPAEIPPFREEGVSDATWTQVQKQKKEQKDRREARDSEIEKLRKELAELISKMTRQRELSEDEMRRLKEIKDKIEKLLSDKAREKAILKALKKRGPCENGYHWDREGDGWRCQGGYHYVTDDTLGGWL